MSGLSELREIRKLKELSGNQKNSFLSAQAFHSKFTKFIRAVFLGLPLKSCILIWVVVMTCSCGINKYQAKTGLIINNQLIAQQELSYQKQIKYIESFGEKPDLPVVIKSVPIVKIENSQKKKNQILYHNHVAKKQDGLPGVIFTNQTFQEKIYQQPVMSYSSDPSSKPLFIKDFVWAIAFLLLGLLFLASLTFFNFLSFGFLGVFITIGFICLIIAAILIVIGLIDIFKKRPDDGYNQNQNAPDQNKAFSKITFSGLLVFSLIFLILGLLFLYLATQLISFICIYIGLIFTILGIITLAKYVIKRI